MKNIIFILSVSVLLASCQSTKDAFTLKKKDQIDEFLVEKKNPLVLPPNFDDLPEPEDGKNLADREETSFQEDVKKILKNNGNSDDIKIDNSNNSLEDSILKKIK